MKTYQYVLGQIALGIIAIVAAHPAVAVPCLIGMIWVAAARCMALGHSGWWSLLVFVPFGWIAIAFFKPKAA